VSAPVQNRSADDVINDVLAKRFPSNLSLEVAQGLRDFLQLDPPDLDRWLIRVGLFLDEATGQYETVKALKKAVEDLSKDRPLYRHGPAPGLSLPLPGEGVAELLITRRISPSEASVIEAAMLTTLRAYTDQQGDPS
jgi:hypothetical protein